MAWLVLEDNRGRAEAFTNAAARCAAPQDIRIWRIAAHMVRDLPELLGGATLLSLDHDLYKQEDTDPDPGCGRDVVSYLAKQKPVCPVIIHSTNTEAAWGMYNELAAAGWKVEIIHHLDEPGWIDTRWFALARQLTGTEA